MSYNPFSLSGKTILVTGASSGIGQATAIECSKMGAKLVITGRNAERLQETMNQLEGEGHRQIAADLAAEDSLSVLTAALPPLDGVVNNAGVPGGGLIPFFKPEVFDQIFKVNLLAPIQLIHRLVKARKINKGGAVVFTSSIGKSVVSVGSTLYAATKGGVSSFMKGAALELAAKKIRCNAVLPGMVATPLMTGLGGITKEQWDENMNLYPLKRFGTPEDVARAIVFYLSDASSWITGSELVVDGGRSLR